MKDYVNLGAELGTVGTAVAEGADAWLRQGKSCLLYTSDAADE